jgi:hypothetical protein
MCESVWYFRSVSSGWSKSHTAHIKIFTDDCNSIYFNWINKHIISLWLYKSPRRSCHVHAHASLSVVFKQWSARMSFSQVQWVFTVEHYLASCSYLTCQNEFRDTFPDSPVPNELTIPCLMNHFHDTGSAQKLFTGLHQTWGKEWIHASLMAMDISNT